MLASSRSLSPTPATVLAWGANFGPKTLHGSVASVAWNPEVMSVGASGAVFGVGGALLGFLLLRRDSIPAVVLVPLRNSMFSFIGFNVVFGFLVPGIDNAAHLGGLAGGLVCGFVLSQPLEIA